MGRVRSRRAGGHARERARERGPRGSTSSAAGSSRSRPPGIAAERATKKDLARLRRRSSAWRRAAARPPSQAAEERFHEADIAFHQALIAATGNRALGGLVERIHSALLVARFPLARPQYRQERALPEHRRILDAVAAGDPAEARQAMSDHLDTIAGYLEEHRGTVRREARGGPPASAAVGA